MDKTRCNVTFCIIVFNGDYVLHQLLSTIYTFAHKIIIVDGVVEYWRQKGFTGSTDNTKRIIKNFHDPQKKIKAHFDVVAIEKDELCQTFMQDVPEDTDYLWCPDSDEIFKPGDIYNTIQMLKAVRPHSVSFRSNSFFGGFDYILGGFEREHNFKRLLKYEPGCTYLTHRPPTLSSSDVPNAIQISAKEMADRYGVEMYHYSYVWPKQVKTKIDYYKEVVSKDNCIDDYFNKIWLPWVKGDSHQRDAIEDQYNGVHEFKPSYRGPCRTQLFTGEHPVAIQWAMDSLKLRFTDELNELTNA